MPDNTKKSGLDQLCSKDRAIYENYYSQTHRAEFKVGGEMGTWDIIHISLPFNPVKERELKARFNLADEDLEGFYADFGRCVKNYIATAQYLAAAEVDSVVRIRAVAIEKKESRGSDIYIVTEPMHPIVEVLWDNAENLTSIENIINLGTRLCQITKGISDAGAHFGIVDLDSIYIVRAHERNLTTMGGFLYAHKNAAEPFVKLPAALPAHAHPALVAGTVAPSLATDVYSICSLLWTLLAGNHYTTPPDLSTLPTYAPEDVADVLTLGLDETNIELPENQMLEVVKTINKALHKCAKRVRSEDGEENMDNIAIPMSGPIYDLSVAYRREWKFSKPRFAQTPVTPGPATPVEPTSDTDTVPTTGPVAEAVPGAETTPSEEPIPQTTESDAPGEGEAKEPGALEEPSAAEEPAPVEPPPTEEKKKPVTASTKGKKTGKSSKSKAKSSAKKTSAKAKPSTKKTTSNPKKKS